MMGQVRPSVPSDIEEIEEQGLRSADMVELQAAGLEVNDALRDGYCLSIPFCLTVSVDGVASAMFGVAQNPEYPNAGTVWLLGTDRLMGIQTQFLRESRKWLDLITQEFQVVGNLVHRGNHVHIRWLQWLGFSFLAEIGPFIEFARITDVQQQPSPGTEPERSPEREHREEGA